MLKHPSLRDLRDESPRDRKNWERAVTSIMGINSPNSPKIILDMPEHMINDPMYRVLAVKQETSHPSASAGRVDDD